MASIRLGSTGIEVEKNGFGALPIQRVPPEEAAVLLRKAYKGGIRFFDTSRSYSDSEAKLNLGLGALRSSIVIASKTPSKTGEGLKKDLAASLAALKTDYLDIYQFHNPHFCPRPGDGSGLWEAMIEAKEAGKVRHIGISNHRMHVAEEAVDSGLYETLQYPFSYLAAQKEIELVEKCGAAGMGFIAMKGLAGGLITNSSAASAWMNRFDHVLPIWGIQHEWELDEFLAHIANPPALGPEIQTIIEKDRAQLLGEFCRGCGYCLPCPAGIEINMCARISLLIRRSQPGRFLSADNQAMMKKVEGCLHCDSCKAKCPYGLDTPSLLERNYIDYKEILAGKVV